MIEFLPEHSYVSFEYRYNDIVIKGDVFYHQFDSVAELGEVTHDCQRVQAVHQSKGKAETHRMFNAYRFNLTDYVYILQSLYILKSFSGIRPSNIGVGELVVKFSWRLVTSYLKVAVTAAMLTSDV